MNDKAPARLVRRSLLIALVVLASACGAPEGEAGPDCPATAPSPLPTPPWNQDPELADRIPDEVGGSTIEVQTACATVVDPGGLTTSPEFLESVGVALQDVTVAISPGPAIGETDDYVAVTAWRYAGASEDDVRSTFLSLLEEAEIAVEDETIGGKQVHRALLHAYYVQDDTLYAVLGEEEDLEAVIEALP